MEIPLVLSTPRPGRLVYALPIWFRIMMGCILGVVVASLVSVRDWPGILGWIILVVLALGLLYEDTWIFDATEERAMHRAGLVIAARTTVVEFASIARFRIVPLVKGTVPGTEDERAENAAALQGRRGDDGRFKRSHHKKAFLNLTIESTDGTLYLVDHLPARCAEQLRSSASRLAELCGKPLSEE